MNTQQTRNTKPVDYKFDGGVKLTSNQIKKHHKFFSSAEKVLLECCVLNISTNHLIITAHARLHISSLTHSLAKETLMDCKVIEFNVNQKNNIECRVLVRGNKTLPIRTDRGIENGNVCIVINIKTNVVVSAYINVESDSHNTLDIHRYNKGLDIIKYAMELN